MKNKDIDKAAREYAEDRYRYCCDDLGEPMPEDVNLKLTSYESDYNSFTAGAKFRQSEIDLLKAEFERVPTHISEQVDESMEAINRAYELGRRDCQSEIDELREAVEEMRWIPVSERLPEVGATVLIKVGDSDKFVSTAHFAHERFIVDFYDMRDDEPTHWRPIDSPKATQLLEKYGKKQ